MRVLVTGAAGFIGARLCEALLERGDEVVGVDNLNAYYDPSLKRARLGRLLPRESFRFELCDLADEGACAAVFARGFDAVVHFAAQAGVRHALVDPGSYARSNLVGMANVLEGCRAVKPRHLVYASSSSVYGDGLPMPLSEASAADEPLSLYAATKRSGELMARSYAHLFGLPCTGLRFFTVHGPWGRPDMALWGFADAIAARRPVRLFNQGRMSRDFTYVDDAAAAALRALDLPPSGPLPARVLNVGSGSPVSLLDYVAAIGEALGIEPIVELAERQPGDALDTWADVSALRALTGCVPSTSMRQGVERFVVWQDGWLSSKEPKPLRI